MRDVTRDSKGFIWYLANGKVYRYDGYNSMDLMSSLTNNDQIGDIPQHILIDNKDRLWIVGTSSLSYLDLKTWIVNKISEDKLPDLQVRDVLWIKEAPNGSIVIGYSSGHILLFKNGKSNLIEDLYAKGLQTKNNIRARSCAFWRGHAWIGTSSGDLMAVSLLTGNKTQIYSLGNIQNPVEFILPQKDHLILDIFNRGIYRYSPDISALLQNKDKTPIDYTERHLLTQGGKFYVYTENGKMQLLSSENLMSLQGQIKFSANEPDIFDVEIYNDEILLATSEGIWVCYKPPGGIASLIPQNNNPNKSVRGIHRFSDGSIFYCSYGGAGFITKNGITHSFPNLYAGYAILPLNQTQLLIGVEGGELLVFDKITLSLKQLEYTIPKMYPPKTHRVPSYVISLAHDSNRYYIGAKKGLFILDKKTKVLQAFSDNKGVNHSLNLEIRSITAENNRLLLGTHLGLMQYVGGKWKKLYPLEKDIGVYNHIVKNDTIWLATQGKGVVAINNAGQVLKIINEESGLSDNLVYSLVFANGYKIAGTSNGLNIIKGNKIKSLNSKGIVNNSEFNHGAAFYTKEYKQVYIGGLNGYTILDIDRNWTKDTNNAPVYITEISIADTRQGKLVHDYTIPYRQEPTVKLEPYQDFLNISIGEPQNYKAKSRLSYQIAGITKQWQPIPSGNNITLMGMEPKEYILNIKPAELSAKGLPISLNIVKIPAFHQTWIFRTLLLLLVIGIVWWIANSRIRKIKKEQALRTRISADLHDEVGSLLSGISMQAEFLQISKKDLPKDTYLTNIADSSKEAIRAMGDIVWSIDARNDNWKSLLAKIREYAYNLFGPASIDFAMEEKGSPPASFSQKERQAIYLIVKEALNNISKHSKADWVSILFSFSGNAIIVKIKDNGIGFKQNGEFTGQGLKNMQQRAAKIKGSLEITHPEKGTEITLTKTIRRKNYLWG